jgi:hypothetical protein
MYNRHVYLGEWSEVGVDYRCTYLTPNENAARRLGVEPAPQRRQPTVCC